ncbi:MAG: DsbA family protein [Gammaproteobacteria bacterium]
MIEFSDYQCPYCKRFSNTTLPVLKAEYIDTGKIRYVFRDFPLEQRHGQARKAAEAAHCAGDQGKYWEMHDIIFRNQQALQDAKLKAYARNLGLNPTTFDGCLDTDKYTDEVKKDFEDGVTAGVQGTPAFFIGKLRPDNRIHGTLISGAQSITVFRQEIDRLLRENHKVSNSAHSTPSSPPPPPH